MFKTIDRTSGVRMICLAAVVALGLGVKPLAAPESARLNVEWNKTVRVSQTLPTLQVVVNPFYGASPRFTTSCSRRSRT
jgi:hypothetical protein